jgi:hypothetical protein
MNKRFTNTNPETRNRKTELNTKKDIRPRTGIYQNKHKREVGSLARKCEDEKVNKKQLEESVRTVNTEELTL